MHSDPATTSEGEKLPTLSKLFPRDKMPNFIFKAKNGFYHYVMEEPTEGKGYLWYMSEPKLVSVAQLEEEMRVPGRRWFATDKVGYMLQKKVGSTMPEDGIPYVCLQNIHNREEYWVGKRHEKPPVDKTMLVISVAELYLKSAIHQKRLMRLLILAISRVVGHPLVSRNGLTMIEVRKYEPTPEQMKILTLLPGIGKIYEAKPGRQGDPRGNYIADGAGGIPIVPDQRVLTLLSGGIDSPVAAYRMMTRGCTVNGIHFLNSTNDTAAVMEKNRRICEKLSLIQGRFDMHYVDISKLQSQIVANVPNHNRTLLYKWTMLSLAASFDDSLFIVTGDSVGQVASQTTHNISTLYPTIKKAVIAPLTGMHKNYIISEARKIGTYELSTQEGDDCCQYMMCKTGANLWMGPRTLRACIRRIVMEELSVTSEVFRDGKLFSSTTSKYMPGSGQRTSMPSAEVAEENREEEDVVYFDAAAGTLMPQEVKQAILTAPEGNPNSLHQSGREARMAIEKVRGELAAALGLPATDIVFTSGGTESNTIALHGYQVLREDWAHASTQAGPEVPSGAPVVKVVDLVNHETGSVNRLLKRPPGGRLHVDASQALAKIDFSALDLSEVDSMTVTAHKINGPVGVGAVYLRNLECNKIFSGGSQERGVRPGTENVAGIVGFGTALRLDRSRSIHQEVDAMMVDSLTEMGFDLNRRGETSGYIVHATLPEGYDNTEVVSLLSSKYHVEIGTGSACKSGEVNTTVYDTLGKKPEPKRSLRFSWDSFVTMKDAEKVIESLKKVLQQLKPKK